VKLPIGTSCQGLGHTARVSALFEFDDVQVRDGAHEILRGVTLAIAEGGITVLMGPSGSGKSTLLRLCNRMEVASSGEIRFRGRPLTAVDPIALRREVGMVFQRPTPFPGTVAANLRAAAELDDAPVDGCWHGSHSTPRRPSAR
jgi:putative ABC transport system ATP-binding protein